MVSGKECRGKIVYKKQPTVLSEKMIIAAIQGEERALQAILVHYERYINRLSSRELYDRYGNIYVYQDSVLKMELQNRLVAGILKFRISR